MLNPERDYTQHDGTVYRIQISGQHFNNQNASGYEVAVKHLSMPENQFFTQASQTLKTMRDLQHPHLIRAHSVINRGMDKCFVFPYAEEGDLAHFWKSHDTESEPNVMSWALMQMRGLADGVNKLHEKETSHGDIKPQNILIFNNTENHQKTLVIADIGLAKYRALNMRKKYDDMDIVPISNKGRYEPPEIAIRASPISHSYDIWSLGCVLLEFIIWLVSGPRGFEDFLRESTNRDSDRFWENRLVKPVIADRIAALENKLEQQGEEHIALKRVLNLIRERLLVGVYSRANSAELFENIDGIYSQYLSHHNVFHSSEPQLQSAEGNHATSAA
ncbi:hypothetical protein O1611_g395 [Lasiodiplodia mahajangana]|uniref:Uncharacterized protein n=1 Tax=Lasiodiplodia mahajangana TaxID=1108764 RepID=A0ACC2K115_9PEZI|nr:hypothetical protein O1611_g395 [Lasiodiplodia mahajangana]